MTQDGQQRLAVTNDIKVTSDMTLKQLVSTDKEANDQDQLKPVIEKMLCARRYKGKRWYKVKRVGISKTEWVTEDVVPRNVQQEYFVAQTVVPRYYAPVITRIRI